jgi:hypothetical protein
MEPMRYAIPASRADRLVLKLRQDGRNAVIPPVLGDGVTEVYIMDVPDDDRLAVHQLVRRIEPRANPVN